MAWKLCSPLPTARCPTINIAERYHPCEGEVAPALVVPRSPESAGAGSVGGRRRQRRPVAGGRGVMPVQQQTQPVRLHRGVVAGRRRPELELGVHHRCNRWRCQSHWLWQQRAEPKQGILRCCSAYYRQKMTKCEDEFSSYRKQYVTVMKTSKLMARITIPLPYTIPIHLQLSGLLPKFTTPISSNSAFSTPAHPNITLHLDPHLIAVFAARGTGEPTCVRVVGAAVGGHHAVHEAARLRLLLRPGQAEHHPAGGRVAGRQPPRDPGHGDQHDTHTWGGGGGGGGSVYGTQYPGVGTQTALCVPTVVEPVWA